MAGWSPGHLARRSVQPPDRPAGRRLTLRIWPKRQVVLSLAVVDVRRASDSTRV
jgi:hypothetical protein